jgi:hypothetical protein
MAHQKPRNTNRPYTEIRKNQAATTTQKDFYSTEYVPYHLPIYLTSAKIHTYLAYDTQILGLYSTTLDTIYRYKKLTSQSS